MTGDTTPISDEAVRAFTDRYRSHFTVPLLIADDLVADALAAARPLLVSAEAELLRESVAIHLRERERLEDGIRQLTESHRVEVEGLRAELAAALAALTETDDRISAAFDVLRGMADEVNILPVVRALESSHAPTALRAAGGQEKPTATHKPFTDDGVTYCGWDGHEGCGEVWPCSTVRAAAVSGPPSWDQVMERVGQRRLLRAIELSADCTCPPGPLPATYDGPMPVCAIHPPTLEEAHELIDRLRAAAPVGGQAEPSDAQIDALFADSWDADDLAEHERVRAAGGSASDQRRAVYRRRLAAAAVSGKHRNQDGKTHHGPPDNCRECAYEDGAYL